MSTISVKLSRPVEAHGDEAVQELTIREPKAADIIACGMPITFSRTRDGSTVTHIDTQAVGALISRLSGVPPSTVGQLAAPDFMVVVELITGFFQPAAPKTP